MSSAPAKLVSSEISEGSDAPLNRFGDCIERIGGQLKHNGAMGLVVVSAGTLEEIERKFGVEVHQIASQRLSSLVIEACGAEIESDDLVVSGAVGADEIFVFLFRSRSDDQFYRESIDQVAASIASKIAAAGNRIVYPYRRDMPCVPVGSSFAIHNPGISEDRQVREAIDRARADAELNAKIETRNRAKRFLDLVLAEDVTALYEPIVNVTTREVIGYEALSRGPWDTELHAPEALFEMGEKTGLVFELDCLCRRIALRGARGLSPGKLLFLNCLPTAIHDPAFRGDVLKQTLEELRLRPSDVVFEISEKESIHNFEIFREARDYYGDLGFKVALDDTGVAYGSLEAIMELSPDFIKVDLTLVRGIDTDPPRQELLRALNGVAASINASVIAEGIETSEELATIHELGIPYGQGYLFGRPAPLRRAV
ncbi:MAG: EAL domain-containing protein [Deltaproteobacteria bacterium]|nr:EAL domain-containing protein [Deltaproteobacteria bacterium]MBW2723193.1 EAL domain-containing protein [Deltaproteobacteria bacterium]